MTEINHSNKENRPGNSLPTTTPNESLGSFARNFMLYTYHNTVDTIYIGDVRLYAMKIGDYLRDSKSKVYDVKQNKYIDIPIKYAAPNLAFSDNMPETKQGKRPASGVFPNASITDRIVLPVISYYMTDMKYDNKRAVDPVVRWRYKPVKSCDPAVSQGRVFTTHFPQPMNYSYQIDIWCEYREHYHQLLTAFQSDFNPYSYLTDLYDYIDETQRSFYMPYAKMNLISSTDNSNFIPGTDRRIVRGTVRVEVEGWLTPTINNTPLVKPVLEIGLGPGTPGIELNGGL